MSWLFHAMNMMNATEPSNKSNIGSGNDLVLSSKKNITWANDVPDFCCHMALLGQNELNACLAIHGEEITWFPFTCPLKVDLGLAGLIHWPPGDPFIELGQQGFREYHVTSSPPSDEYMHRWTGSALVQIMACCQYSAKQFSKLVLGYCQLDP